MRNKFFIFVIAILLLGTVLAKCDEDDLDRCNDFEF